MAPRERRYQPAREALRKERWSIPKAADQMDIPVGHLYYCVAGWATPSPDLRERLPKLLGIPLEQLFDEQLLRREWTGHRNGRAAS